MPFGLPVATPKITSGNVRTSYDPIATSISSIQGYLSGPTFGQYGLACPLGTVFDDQGGPDSVSGTLTQLPLWVGARYKYVLYKSTTNPALVAQPGLVYYTDETQTVVSGAIADGATATASSLAGVMMINTTDLSTITAAILNNSGNGSGIWICIGGFVKGCTSITSTALGDALVGSSTAFTPARVAAGTAPTFTKTLTALTAIASGVSDVLVNICPIA